MTIRFLLDTDTVSDLVRNPRGPVTSRIRRHGEASVATSIIVAAELRFGAAKRGSARLSRQVDTILGALPVLPLGLPADESYADARNALEAIGRPIGANDLLIAAHALSLSLVLVTGNVDEFRRVPALQVENWLVP